MPSSKHIVVANWKMNKLPSQAKPLVAEILMSYLKKNSEKNSGISLFLELQKEWSW